MIPGPPPVMIENPARPSTAAVSRAFAYIASVRGVRAEPKIETAGPTCESAAKPCRSSSSIRFVRASSSSCETIAAVSASSSSSSADVGGRGCVRRYSSSSSGVQPSPSIGTVVDPLQVDDEDERLAGTDLRARALVAVGEVRRDDEQPAAALLHPRDALVPARDDLAGAERERERLRPAVPRRVELPPVDHELPTYWTSTTSPFFAALPLPSTMSTLSSWAGGSPDGRPDRRLGGQVGVDVLGEVRGGRRGGRGGRRRGRALLVGVVAARGGTDGEEAAGEEDRQAAHARPG